MRAEKALACKEGDGTNVIWFSIVKCRDTIPERVETKAAARRKCRDPGSNWGPPDLQSDALPTELSRPC